MVDGGHDVGPREHEQIVVALHIVWMPGESIAAKIRFGQLVTLDHRPHRAVEDEYPLRHELMQRGQDISAHRGP